MRLYRKEIEQINLYYMGKGKLILVLFLLSFSGCKLFYPPTDFFHPFCYDGENTGIDSLIDINGYYLIIDSVDDEGKMILPESRTNFILIFYKDGIFAHSIYDENSDYDERYLDWGLYRFCNDTIKVRFVASRVHKWRPAGEAWYKITNSNTIEALIFKYSGGITQEMIDNRFMDKRYKIHYAKFIPSNDLPDSDRAQIKKDKLFWCNQKKYKEWRIEQKRKRIK
jgi:hypothetical protein